MENQLVHVVNRGVDRRTIFFDDKDFLRFIYNLLEFNDKEWISNSSYHFGKRIIDFASRYKEDAQPVVVVHAFSIMPNHYHLLLSPKIENGVSIFMRKINMGYAKYFNARYERTGTLFEGRYKSIIINNDNHLTYIPYYIHMNPLDLFMPTWREGVVSDTRSAIKFLEKYRWSSFLDYVDIKNFPSVISKNFLTQIIGSADEYRKNTEDWLSSMNNKRASDSSIHLE